MWVRSTKGRQEWDLTLYVMKINIRKNERKTDKPYARARKERDTGGTGSLRVLDSILRYASVWRLHYPVGSTLSVFPLSSPSSSLLACSELWGEVRPLPTLEPLLLSLPLRDAFPLAETKDCAMWKSSLRWNTRRYSNRIPRKRIARRVRAKCV